MATDQKEEKVSLLRDMNGNSLREGDLVMVLLEKPVLVGFIAEIKEPSILTNRDKNPVGVLTVKGQISLPFQVNQLTFLRQTAKLVDPRSEALVAAITQMAKTKEEPVVENPTGPALIPDAPAVDPIAD